MTDFPTPIHDTGYMLPGWPTKTSARNQTAAWLVAERGLTTDAAADAVDGVFVANDCWWSNNTPEGAPEGSEAGFVMSPDYPGAIKVTVVMISLEWINV
jgi:hypothetical protein